MCGRNDGCTYSHVTTKISPLQFCALVLKLKIRHLRRKKQALLKQKYSNPQKILVRSKKNQSVLIAKIILAKHKIASPQKFVPHGYLLLLILNATNYWAACAPSHKMGFRSSVSKSGLPGEGRHEGLVPRNDVLTNGFI